MQVRPPKLAIAAWGLCIVVGLLAGCLTPQQQAWTCDRAAEAYVAYQAAEAAGIVSDKETIAAVKVAAAYLAAYCGWQPAATVVATSGAQRSVPTCDHNGILILKP